MIKARQGKHIPKVAFATLALAIGGASLAQSYPARPITVMDNIPGGAFEAAKRAALTKIRDNTGVTIVYEPRPGGGGAPALQALKAAAPDGYTFGMTYASALNLGPLLNPDLNIDPIKDFAPVTIVTTAGTVWTGRIDHPAKDLRDLVAMAKAKPESVKVGVFGPGNRFFVAQIEEKTGAKFLQVPYKTTPDGMAAVLSGQIDASFDSVGGVLGQEEKIKVFMYSTNPRIPQFPNVPTSMELYGVEQQAWSGILAPAGTPAEPINWMARELARAMKDPAITKIFVDQRQTIIANTPAEFAAKLRTEVDDYRALIKKYPNIR